MIEDLIKEFAETQRDVIIGAIEIKVKRKLKSGDDRVQIHYDKKLDYGAIIYEGDVMGFLHVDYAEPCIVFTPSPNLLP